MQLTPIKNINSSTRNWTAKVKVLEKWSPSQHSPVKLQKLILADAEVEMQMYWIQGNISIVSLNQNFWLMVCPNCQKSIRAKDEVIFDCFNCNRKKVMAKPSVQFKVRLTDASGSMIATMFEDYAKEYFLVDGKKLMKFAAELLRLHLDFFDSSQQNKRPESCPTSAEKTGLLNLRSGIFAGAVALTGIGVLVYLKRSNL
ncbi:hypothetical protein RHMOL_Rhmol08G0059300 [Rhododendron molle]|uniref:Uncharacterized protein n=1 Tax=Rhododendron molle TaxID=49168 RepID=A0ACC0MLG7_RHOML|nr:hypothetical protein RHMOL_Rhmol08G0059300 [Rhododendron molle]